MPKRNDRTNENTNILLRALPFSTRKPAMYPPASLRWTRQAGESIDQCDLVAALAINTKISR